jgi:hypothetical protein
MASGTQLLDPQDRWQYDPSKRQTSLLQMTHIPEAWIFHHQYYLMFHQDDCSCRKQFMEFTLIQSFKLSCQSSYAFCTMHFGRKCSTAIFSVSKLVLLDAEVMLKKTVNYTGQFEAVWPIMSNVT